MIGKKSGNKLKKVNKEIKYILIKLNDYLKKRLKYYKNKSFNNNFLKSNFFLNLILII